MSRELAAAIRMLPDHACQIEREDGDAIRHWAEVAYVPSDGVAAKDRPAPPREPDPLQRGKAGTVEHPHHVLTNELAAAALRPLPHPTRGLGLEPRLCRVGRVLGRPVIATALVDRGRVARLADID